jgi:hypothetical protein
VLGIPVKGEHRLTVTMEMSVPTIGVKEGASTLITLMPVMMAVNVPKVIPVLMEAVQEPRSPVVMEMVVPLIPVIP